MASKRDLGVPLYGELNLRQRRSDLKPLSVKNTSGTEVFAIAPLGNMLPRLYTTRPTTGLVKGELMLLFHGSTPKLGICSSTAAQTIKLIRFKTKTFGRLTA